MSQALTRPAASTSAVSLREKSITDLQSAIRSPKGDAERQANVAAIMKRTRTVLALYYDPDKDMQERAAVLNEFVEALSDLPLWAVEGGFDAWRNQMGRRPSPGEIRVRALNQMRPIGEEIARREAEAKEARDFPDAPPRDPRVAEILNNLAGETIEKFQTKLAEQETPKQAHWSHLCDRDDPRWKALQRSRAKNTLINMKGTN